MWMRWEGGWEVAVGDGRGKEDIPSTPAQGSSVLLSPISQDPSHVSSTLTLSKPPPCYSRENWSPKREGSCPKTHP